MRLATTSCRTDGREETKSGSENEEDEEEEAEEEGEEVTATAAEPFFGVRDCVGHAVN